MTTDILYFSSTQKLLTAHTHTRVQQHPVKPYRLQATEMQVVPL